MSTKLLLLSLVAFLFFNTLQTPDESKIEGYIIDPRQKQIRLFWKASNGDRYGSIKNLKSALDKEKSTLVFAMNGGMYKPDHSPQGLFIENGVMRNPIDTNSGSGNFYMKPNGVFYITSKGNAFVSKTTLPFELKEISYATQSGPMLVSEGLINAKFKPASGNINIRNGVGILPDGNVLFAISTEKINFYNFALYFKSKGCRDALYLDGYVSRMYLPERGFYQTDGDFGVIIGVTPK